MCVFVPESLNERLPLVAVPDLLLAEEDDGRHAVAAVHGERRRGVSLNRTTRRLFTRGGGSARARTQAAGKKKAAGTSAFPDGQIRVIQLAFGANAFRTKILLSKVSFISSPLTFLHNT